MTTEHLAPSAPPRLTGTVHPPEYFRFVERTEIDWEVWDRVVRGELTGAIFRGVLPPDACTRICANFWASPLLKRPDDGLPAHGRGFVGASLVGPPLEEYFADAERMRPGVQALFDGTDDALPALLREFGQHLARRGVTLRLAERQGRKAGMFKMRSWQNTGTFVLGPHDDAGALRSPTLKNFELQALRRVVGAVACVENSDGGELHYWNISPDEETRNALGQVYDSVGYPLESLDGFEKLTVPVGPGDVYIFDSSKVHAVGRKDDDTTNRTNVLWSMGVLDDTTFLHWA